MGGYLAYQWPERFQERERMLIQRTIIITAAGLCAAASTVMAQDAISPQARETLDQVAAFYRGLEGLSASSKMTMDESGLGENETSDMSCRLQLQRPNRFSIVYEDNEGGGLILTSNGDEAMTWMEMNDLYYTGDAPSNFMESVLEMQDVMDDGESGIDAAMMLPHAPIMMLMTEGGVEDLLQNAVGLKFVGPEMLGEQSVDHIIIETPGVDVDMWFASGEQRWLLKSVPDMSKMFKEMMEEMAQFGDLEEMGIDLDDMPKMEISIKFEDWKANPDFDEQAFSVTPPEAAEAAESLDELFGMDMDFGDEFGGLGDEPDDSLEMLGRAAPDLELDLLDGGTMSLAQHKGKDIVVLDFWATWCPPCREGLPIVAEVTSRLADQGVVFYAVNLREQDEQAQAFLEKEGLDIAVAMDRDGASSMPFSLDAIPQTYIIDKDGIVQARHIGMMPNLKKQLTEELETLIEGGSLVDPKPEQANAGVDETLPMALEQVWSVAGSWSGVDSQDGEVYATKAFGNTGGVFDADGTKLRSLKSRGGDFGSVIRMANLDKDEASEFVTFRTWGKPVQAWDDDGTALWTYGPGLAPDDAWAGDVDGDGIDEIAIGFNGSDGVHLVSADGSSRWKYTRIGNVWHVCIADTDGNGTKEVVTTSAAGKVHVFSATGENTANFRAGSYANMVRSATNSAGESIAFTEGMGQFAGTDYSGSRVFEGRFPGAGMSTSMAAAQAAPGKPWIAVGFRGGPISVVDLDTGEIIATLAVGNVEDLSWIETDGDPLLVYTTGGALEARRLVAQTADDATVEP